VPTVAVVLNKYDESQPFDEYGNRWEEVVREYFNMDPFVVPADEELERIMVLDVIPLSRLPELEAARAIVRGHL